MWELPKDSVLPDWAVYDTSRGNRIIVDVDVAYPQVMKKYLAGSRKDRYWVTLAQQLIQEILHRSAGNGVHIYFQYKSDTYKLVNLPNGGGEGAALRDLNKYLNALHSDSAATDA